MIYYILFLYFHLNHENVSKFQGRGGGVCGSMIKGVKVLKVVERRHERIVEFEE